MQCSRERCYYKCTRALYTTMRNYENCAVVYYTISTKGSADGDTQIFLICSKIAIIRKKVFGLLGE